MTLADLANLLRDGGVTAFAAIFLWLYLNERKMHNKTQDERVSDLREGLSSLHKSISVLDEARAEVARR